MATFITIRAGIKAKLNELVGVGQPIAYVYDYHNSAPEGYPCVTFDVSEASNDFLTNAENVRKIAWSIVIYQEVSKQGLSVSNALLDAVSDAVISKLESNSSLGGVVDFSNPVVGNRETIEGTSGIVRAQFLTLHTTYTALV